jgi:hypothetical protein
LFSIGYSSTPPTPDKVLAQNDIENDNESIGTKDLFNITKKPQSINNVDSESIATEALFNCAKIPERIDRIEEEGNDSTTDEDRDVNVPIYKSDMNCTLGIDTIGVGVETIGVETNVLEVNEVCVQISDNGINQTMDDDDSTLSYKGSNEDNDDDDNVSWEQNFEDNMFKEMFVDNEYACMSFQQLDIAIANYESNSGINLRIGRSDQSSRRVYNCVSHEHCTFQVSFGSRRRDSKIVVKNIILRISVNEDLMLVLVDANGKVGRSIC